MLVLVLLLLVQGAFCNVPVVTDVDLSVGDQMRYITVQYTAESKPVVLWVDGSFISYLDNSTNAFKDGQGEARVWIYINERTDNIEYKLAAEFYSDSYHMTLNIAKGDVRMSPMKSTSVPPIKLVTSPEGTISFASDEVVPINVKVESDDLSPFTIDSDWGDLSSFEYESYPPVTVFRRRSWWRNEAYFENANAFIWPKINITSASNTVANSTALIDTSFPFVTGEYEFGVTLNLPDTYLVSKVTLRRYVYLKNESDESPFRRNANFVHDNRNRKRVDMLIQDHSYTQIDAMGYPKPVLKLLRECTEVTEPEVRIIDIGTPYRTRNIFQFTNMTASLSGAYYFTAESGDTTLTKMQYITQLS